MRSRMCDQLLFASVLATVVTLSAGNHSIVSNQLSVDLFHSPSTVTLEKNEENVFKQIVKIACVINYGQ